jgi:hypothetical protein
MSFDKTVEALIKEAQARGDFDHLPGKGKPVDLSVYFSTPEETRVAQSVLKNAGMIPPEIELLQEIAALKESLNAAQTDFESTKIRKLLTDKQLQFDLLIESRK